jgi:predicted DNA-binding protein with PD1-like motif
VIVAESSRTRRLVGRIDRGTDLLQQLTELCRSHRVHAGQIRAVGALEDVVLGDRRSEGAFELLTFTATVAVTAAGPSLQAYVTLAHTTTRALSGGRLTSARVVSCDFVVDAYDDVSDAVDAAAAPPVKPATFDAPARTTWSDVVAASERRVDAPRIAPVTDAQAEDDAARAADHGEVHVKAGDYIDHPKFGRCQVERVDSDQEFISARLRNQRLIRLSLEVLTLIPAGQEDGHNLFRAVAGK